MYTRPIHRHIRAIRSAHITIRYNPDLFTVSVALKQTPRPSLFDLVTFTLWHRRSEFTLGDILTPKMVSNRHPTFHPITFVLNYLVQDTVHNTSKYNMVDAVGTSLRSSHFSSINP